MLEGNTRVVSVKLSRAGLGKMICCRRLLSGLDSAAEDDEASTVAEELLYLIAIDAHFKSVCL